jgi:hypothetical protein
MLESIKNIENIQTKEQAIARLKEIKSQTRKLEIAVIAIGLIALSLIILPFTGILPVNLLLILAIVGGILLVVKAFKDGDVLETEKVFLNILLINLENKEK